MLLEDGAVRCDCRDCECSVVPWQGRLDEVDMTGADGPRCPQCLCSIVVD